PCSRFRSTRAPEVLRFLRTRRHRMGTGGESAVAIVGMALLCGPGGAQSRWTTRMSVDSSGSQGNADSGNAEARGPGLPPDARFVSFDSLASNLVAGDTNGVLDVFLRDRNTGTTTRVSVDSSGAQGNGASSSPSLSADGRYVAFQSAADDLVA